MSDHTENRKSDQPGTDATPPADSTIPDSDTGVAAGYTGEPSTFEPEEDVPADGSVATPDLGMDAATGGTGWAAGAEPAPGDQDTGGTGRRSQEAQGLDGDDLSVFQSHWDEFPGHD